MHAEARIRVTDNKEISAPRTNSSDRFRERVLKTRRFPLWNKARETSRPGAGRLQPLTFAAVYEKKYEYSGR